MNDFGFEIWFAIREQVGPGYAFELKLRSWRSNHQPVTRVVADAS